MGVSRRTTASTFTISKILRILHRCMGSRAMLLRCRQDSRRRSDSKILSRSPRSECESRVRTLHLSSKLNPPLNIRRLMLECKWYTKREQSARLAYWASGTGFSQIFGGVVAYGISHTSVSSHFTIAPWKIVFLFAGVLTVVVGFVFLAIMPDSQLNAWWLSEEDRRLAVERIRGNQQGIGNKHFKMSQLKEALTDPITWAFVFFAVVSDIPNGGLSNFFSLLIVSFGFTPEQSLLYGTPAGGIQLVALISWGFITQRYGHRLYLAAGAMATGMIGAIVLVTLPAGNNGGRLAGYYLSGLVPLGFLSLFSLISTNVAG